LSDLNVGTLSATAELKDNISPALLAIAQANSKGVTSLGSWTAAQQRAAQAMAGTHAEAMRLNKDFDDAAKNLGKWTEAEQKAAMAMAAMHEEALKLDKTMSSVGKGSQGPGWLGDLEKAAGAVGPAAAAIAAGAAVAGAGVVAGLGYAVHSVMDLADKMSNLSGSTGIGVEALQKFQFAGAAVGVSAEQIAVGMQKFQRSLVEGSVESMAAISKLGLSRNVLANMLPEDQLATVLEALNDKIPNAANRTQIAATLLGKAGADLIPLGNGIREAMEQAKALGIVLSKDDIGAADRFGDSIGALSMTFGGLFNNIGVTIASNQALAAVIETVTKIVGQMSVWVHDNRAALEAWVTSGVQFAVKAVGWLIGALGDLQKGFGYSLIGIGDVILRFGEFAKGAVPVLDALFKIETKMGDVVIAAAQMAGATARALGQNVAAMGADAIASSITAKIAEHKEELDLWKAAQNTAPGAGAALTLAGQGMVADTTLADAAKKVTAFGESLGKLPPLHAAAGHAAADHAVQLQQSAKAMDGLTKKADEMAIALEADLAKAGTSGMTGLEKSLAGIDTKIKGQAAKISLELKAAIAGGADPEAAAAAVQPLLDKLKELEAAEIAAAKTDWWQGLVGPSAAQVQAEVQQIVGYIGGIGGKAALSAPEVEKLRKKLAELRAQSPEGFNAANDKTGGQAGGVMLNVTSTGPQVDAVKHVTAATIDWSKALGDVANMFQVLGISSSSTLGKIVGLLPSLGAQFQALGKLGASGGLFSTGSGDEFKAGAFSTKTGGGMSTLGGKLAVGSAVGGVLGAGAGMFKEGSTAHGALAGAAMGAQIGAIAGPWGMAAGAVVGGIIGAFHKPSWVKVGKDAGKVLGVEVSKELAQQIESTAKNLKISNKNAALLNISGAMDGKDPRQFGKQVEDLLAGIANKSIPAKEGLEELAKDFGAIADAAMKAGSVGDKAMVGIIKRSRELGVESPEIKEFVKGQLQSATAGVAAIIASFKDEKLAGGLNLFPANATGTQGLDVAAANGKAQSTIFSTVFWANVKELGIVGAADAMKEPFDRLKENLTTVFGPEEISALLGPMESIMGLAGNDVFRGAADGAAGLKAALEGVANAGYLTTDSFAAFEQQAGSAYAQAIAGGATSAQAFQTIGPLLQSLVSASGNYGINLDDATQSMIEQAKAAGIAFKTDPTERLTASIDALTVALGGVPPKIDAIGQSLNGLPSNVLQFPDVGRGYPSPAGGDGIPAFAAGGYVAPRPGGTVVRVAEAGVGEYITPANRGGGGGGSISVSFGDILIPPGSSLDPGAVANAVAVAVRNELGGITSVIRNAAA
jgi:hypothetical protein